MQGPCHLQPIAHSGPELAERGDRGVTVTTEEKVKCSVRTLRLRFVLAPRQKESKVQGKAKASPRVAAEGSRSGWE